MCHVLARRFSEDGVAMRLPASSGLWQREYPHARVTGGKVARTSYRFLWGTVANDKQLKAGEALRQHTLNRIRKQCRWPMHRQQHGEYRPPGIGPEGNRDFI